MRLNFNISSLRMISRRLLRMKVLQVLYADHSQDHAIHHSEKELFFSINKSYDLYHLLLLFPIELMKQEEQRIDAAKQKLRPTQEDLNPNTRFVDNKVVNQLRNNWQLSKYISENKIGWIKYPELFKSVYQKMREKEYYKQYLEKPENTFEDDKEFIVRILEEEIPFNEGIEYALEEQSIFWNDDLEYILSMVIKTIRGFKETDSPQKSLMPLFKNDDDREFAKKLFRRVIMNHEEYNELIKKHSQNWEFDRIAIMDILVMQMAIAEMIEFPSIPIKVSLNEYIDIAKDYSTSNSNTFINGILDNIVKDLKAEGKIQKTGRGLIDS